MIKKILLLLQILTCLSLTAVGDLQLYQAGRKAFSVGLYSIALENFQSYLDSGSDLEKKIETLYLSGISSYYLKKYSVSLSYLNGLEAEYPNSQYITRSIYWSGLNYYYLEDYENAVKYFSRWDEIDASYKDVSLMYKSLSHIRIGEMDYAKDSLLKILNSETSIDRYKEEALYRLGTIYLEEKNLNKSINYLNTLIVDYPESKFYNGSLSILADSYFILKEWNNAERSYKLLELIDPNTNIQKRLATIYYNLGDFNNSIKELQEYTTNVSNDKEALFMLGDLLVKDSRYKDALVVYERVERDIELTEDELEDNFYRIGSLYYKLSDYSSAFNYYKKVLDEESLYYAVISGLISDKDILDVIKNLNNLSEGSRYSLDANNRYINYLKDKNSSGLGDFLEYITNIYPDKIEYSLTYGEYLLSNDQLDLSMKYLSKGFYEGSPYYSNIAYKIGWIYYNKEEFKRSIDYFNRVSKDSENYTKALYSSSIANYKVGNWSAGKDGFLELLDKGSIYSREIAFYLGLIEKDSYNYKKAIEYFNISVEKDTLKNDSLENLSWCYYHLENYSKAIEIYNDLYADNPDDIYLFNIANSFYNLEDYVSASDFYLKVINNGGEYTQSSYYKIVDIEFINRNYDRLLETIKDFYSSYPQSEIPGNQALNLAENLLFSGDIDQSITLFNELDSILTRRDELDRIKFRTAEGYFKKGLIENAISDYFYLIKSDSQYKEESIEEVKNILSDVFDPEYLNSFKIMLANESNLTKDLVPLYTLLFSKGIYNNDPIKEIDSFISLSENRSEIDNLLYLKSLEFYKKNTLSEAENILTTLINRPEVNSFVKCDAILLQGDILVKQEDKQGAINLYLDLYVNYSDIIDKSSYALYKAYNLAKELDDSEMIDKIKNILVTEYKTTEWGEKTINETL